MLKFRAIWDCVTAPHMAIEYTVAGAASAVRAGFILVCTVSFFQFFVWKTAWFLWKYVESHVPYAFHIRNKTWLHNTGHPLLGGTSAKPSRKTQAREQNQRDEWLPNLYSVFNIYVLLWCQLLQSTFNNIPEME